MQADLAPHFHVNKFFATPLPLFLQTNLPTSLIDNCKCPILKIVQKRIDEFFFNHFVIVFLECWFAFLIHKLNPWFYLGLLSITLTAFPSLRAIVFGSTSVTFTLSPMALFRTCCIFQVRAFEDLGIVLPFSIHPFPPEVPVYQVIFMVDIQHVVRTCFCKSSNNTCSIWDGKRFTPRIISISSLRPVIFSFLRRFVRIYKLRGSK